jgi:hypothetical protein
LDEEKVFLSAKQAGFLLSLVRNRDWKHEHAVGCRIIDFWNITQEEHGVAYCYYNHGRILPKSKNEVKEPEGQPVSDIHS